MWQQKCGNRNVTTVMWQHKCDNSDVATESKRKCGNNNTGINGNMGTECTQQK